MRNKIKEDDFENLFIKNIKDINEFSNSFWKKMQENFSTSEIQKIMSNSPKILSPWIKINDDNWMRQNILGEIFFLVNHSSIDVFFAESCHESKFKNYNFYISEQVKEFCDKEAIKCGYILEN